MNYPLISEYIEAIKSAEDNCNELSNLRPVLDDAGEPVMSSGNFAVVFKMEDEKTGKLHAVKCFLREQEGRAEAYRQIAEELEFVNSTFLTPIKYLDKELFVDTNTSEETEYPVLLMDWVEGMTLDKYIREHIDDQYELSLLAYQFSRLAMWLMPQPFAHGDLKPDNILVKDDGTLVLVDYDGMYVPAMKGQKARELGSPDFRHPGRTEEVFDEHIDDFSLASTLLSLKAIALQPSLLEEYGASDRLLFSEKDYRNLSESSALGALQQLMQDAELASLYSLYILALSQNNLSQVSFRLFCLSRPDKSQYEEENLSTEVTEEDLANAVEDNYLLYSCNNKKLLKALDVCKLHYDDCHIKEGTEIICNDVFNIQNFPAPYTIWLPASIKKVGHNALTNRFHSCLSEIIVPLGMEDYFRIMMPQYKHLISCYTTRTTDIEIREGIEDECGSIYSKDGIRFLKQKNYNVKNVIIHNGVKVICENAFEGEFDYVNYHGISDIENIVIPNTVESIGQGAFQDCVSLKQISLPQSIKRIHCGAFFRSSITEITIPDSVEYIAEFAFSCCLDLKKIVFKGCPIIEGVICSDSKVEVIIIPKGSKDFFTKQLPDFIDLFVEQVQ